MSSDQGDEETASDLLTRFRLERILLWSSPVMLILIFAILYFAFIERWLVLRLAPEAAIENVYQRFYRAGRPLAGAWTSAETSSEFLYKFMHGMNKVQSRGRFKRVQENINKNAMELTDVYHASLFTKHRTQKDDAVVAWRIWKRLRRWLFVYVAAKRRDSSLRSE